MHFLNFLNTYLLGAALPPLLLFSGLYFYRRLGAFPLRRPRATLRCLCGVGGRGKRAQSGGRGGLSALTLALAGTLGVGNITGVAVALRFGGAGAVLWLWVGGALAAILKYAEITLALDARKSAAESRGAIDYIRPALGGGAALLFALLSLLLSLTMGSLLQGNVIAEGIAPVLPLPPLSVGLILAAVTLLLFLGGRRGVERLTLILIPLFTLLYVAVSLAVIFVNITSLPSVLSRILREAFSLRSAGAGLGGAGIARAMRAGIGKGLFSNEAGVGTAPFAHGGAEVTSPVRQGVLGLVEVFVDTLLMCSLTALSVLLVFPELPATSATATVTGAFATVLGDAASPFLALSILFFAYATVACWVSYGQTALSHLCRRPAARWLYAPVFAGALALGSVLPADGVWAVCDAVIAAMAILNITAILKNADRIVTLTRNEGLLK